jgi:isoquinoline 1-oxidoreductase beta subunit
VNDVFNISRRGFLKTGAVMSGGLILGMHLRSRNEARAAEVSAEPFAPNAFLRIGRDDTVTVISNHSEMGQGVYTSLALLVAEELEADWSKVRVEAAPVAPAYNHAAFGSIQLTGGSTSTWSEWERLRKAGATARQMLIAAAADSWNVDASTCRAESGHIIHTPSGRKLSYGQLVDKAATMQPPANVTLKDPKDFKLIGKPTKRVDTPEKINGKAIFGLDVALPGMLVAVVARSPVFGGKLKSFDDSKAKAIPGVRHIIKIDRGVAVVADGFWAAKRGRDALELEWDEGALASLTSRSLRARYAELVQKPGAVARKDGDAASALAGAQRKLEALYELPYLAHAPMEPLNCVADVRADSCEVWTGTQNQTVDRANAAAAAGLKPDQVKLNTTFLGGGFGRRAVMDSHFVVEAVQISKAINAPVKVIWTREDDIRGGFYRPMATHALSAGLDAAGNPVAWQHRVVCQSFLIGTPFEAMMVKDGVDEVAVEGSNDNPYDLPNILVDYQMVPSGVPTLWWRSVGHSHSAFAVESFMDELAHAAGKDPFEFRRALLSKQPRHKGVLELVADKAGWGKPVSEGRARGIAVHDSFGSYVAHVAEVSVSKQGELKVHRVVCAIDCGPTVNPDGIKAQMESCIAFGLTAALYGEITFDKGRVQQSNFFDYPMLRIHEMPEVEVHIVQSTDKMGGVGEPGLPPVAPAVANAIFALTGKRLRRLPIRPADLKA